MTSPVFLSHSSKDHAIAETICRALESRGLTCWMSSRDIRPGENFQEAIIRAIRGAGMMVMVFSANSNNSDEVKKEIALAGQHKLLVVPVRVEDVVPAEAFQYELATRQWIDLFGNWEQAIERLAMQIRSVLPASAAPEGTEEPLETVKAAIAALAPAAVPAAAPKPARRSVWPAVLAAVLLIAVSAGGVWWWKNRALAQDADAWASAGQRNSIAAYQGYLQAEPDGHHVADANLRIDELEWGAAVSRNTVAAYEMYKQAQARGRHVAEADTSIAALNAATARAAAAQAAAAKAATTNAAGGSTPQASPNPTQAVPSPPPASAQEEADFKRALQLHSSAEYRNFLAAHGDSAHAADVRDRLASCQMVKTGTGIAQKTRIQAAGKSAGLRQAETCRRAEQDGMKRLDSECPNGAVSWLQTQTLSFTPISGCSVMVYATCAARASQAAAERCR